MLNNFIRTHPKLEYLSVLYYDAEAVLNQEWILPFLKVLNFCRDYFDKGSLFYSILFYFFSFLNNHIFW